MQNETIDKLKNAGYITSTADSQGIADQCQIGGGSSGIDEDYDILKINNFTIPEYDYTTSFPETKIADIENIDDFTTFYDKHKLDAKIAVLFFFNNKIEAYSSPAYGSIEAQLINPSVGNLNCTLKFYPKTSTRFENGGITFLYEKGGSRTQDLSNKLASDVFFIAKK